MARVQPTLVEHSRHRINAISLTLIDEWMSELRAMPYQYSHEWRTPSEVKAARVGDCKGKAIALYDRLQLNGVTNVRFVIGKRRATALLTHAWLEWETRRGTYVLDPTFNWAATAKLPDHSSYVALYAYEGRHKFAAFDQTYVSRSLERCVPAAPSQGRIPRPIRSAATSRSEPRSLDRLPYSLTVLAKRTAL